jgi:hypothetical protein
MMEKEQLLNVKEMIDETPAALMLHTVFTVAGSRLSRNGAQCLCGQQM